MARSVISRIYNTVRAFGGFDSSEVADLRSAIDEAMEEAKAPRGREAKDNLEAWVKSSDPEDLGLGPVSRALARHKAEALEKNAVKLDQDKILSLAIKAVRQVEDGKTPTVPEDVSDAVWSEACNLARLVEDGVMTRESAVDEVHDAIVANGEDGKYEVMASYQAAFKAARAWKAARVRDARDAADAEALESLVGTPEARHTVVRGLRRGDPQAVLAHQLTKTLEGLTKIAGGMDEEKFVALVAKTAARVFVEAGPKKADGSPVPDQEVRLTEPGQQAAGNQAQAEGEIARLTTPSRG